MRVLIVWVCLFACGLVRAQSPQPLILENPYTEREWFPVWSPLSSSFLEPNRFAVSYDATPQRLRLAAGYGDAFVKIRKTSIGAEALIWSGLKTLSGFRFPVETADYFFGLYSIAPIWVKPLRGSIRLRSRLSHISSHYVDGTTDSVIGGSSSKFSREFASVEALLDKDSRGAISVGIKYVFHQVNKNEPAVQFPIGIDYRFLQGEKNTCTVSLSTAAGPAPVYAAGVTFRHKTDRYRAVEVYGEYHTGYSRYGVDGSAKESGFEAGVRFVSFLDLYKDFMYE